MSHYAVLKCNYRDRDALVVALERCGVPKEAIAVHDTPVCVSVTGKGGMANVVVSARAIGTFDNIGFMVETDESKESETIVDDYAWHRTQLVGIKGQRNCQAWLKRVSMEYRAEINIKEAEASFHQYQRQDVDGVIRIIISQ